MTFGSLFSGIGGIDLGLTRAGMECRWMVEIEPFCRKVLAKQFPGVPCHDDIRKLTGSELEPVDLICGGYPCQPFSQAGQRGGESDPRHLWPEMLRLVRVLGPRYVLVENVPGHLSLGFGTVLGDLAGCGYDAEWCCLRASDFGASHLRKRVFVVAYRRYGGVDQRAREARREGGEWASVVCGPEGEGGTVANSDERSRQRGESQPTERTIPPADGQSVGIVADPSRDGERGPDGEEGRSGRRGVCAPGEQLADPGDGLIQEPGRGPQGRDGLGPAGADVPDAGEPGLSDSESETGIGTGDGVQGRATSELRGAPLPFAPGPSDPRWPAILRYRPDLAPALAYAGHRSKRRLQGDGGDGPGNPEETGRDESASSAATPDGPGAETLIAPVRRVVDGLPDWLDRAMKDRTKRLKALGNAVVPQCAQYIGERIMEIEGR